MSKQDIRRRNPDKWKTADEPATWAQKSYIETLADEAGEEPDLNISKAEASKEIQKLREETGRS